MSLGLKSLTGVEAAAFLDDLARLRIQVFRDWPYRYEGTLAYEHQYLTAYTRAPSVLLVLALDGDRVVGASSAMRMSDEDASIRAPIEAAGLDPASICYFGESVLDPAYRGRGLGKAFFAARLAHAESLGAADACFAAVIRDQHDPRRPENAANLEPLWRRFGFAPRPGLILRMNWPEIDGVGDVGHDLQFWFRDHHAS
ncbi:GNAT family N-acetyltransferase [Ahniella affigens]|uniref:GNAT family N-acetyltransferase n=1 Tax=Ahniella affigens TaxID=2021234 RepID=A0A2P1PTY2_9GAMM|nr:GNAT family N-acetyltransferase [Ahniella affigens]AVP98282.1 GNAT family N-acetyltransferase [Ahniella affigens]